MVFILDVWSAGCVLAELLLGQPIFPGDSGVDQLVEIIKVLGTPTRDQIKEMNPNYTEFKFPQIKSHPWQKVSHSIPLFNLFFDFCFSIFILSSLRFYLKKKRKKKKRNRTKFKDFSDWFFVFLISLLDFSLK